MLNVCEIFYSLQGESTLSGRPCVFIRLSGCNLRCSYCVARSSPNAPRRAMGLENVKRLVDEAVALAEALAPDVVLIDPDAGGLESARRIKGQRPATRLILLSVYDRYLAAAADAGADGYLLKGGPVEELLAAIRRPAQPLE